MTLNSPIGQYAVGNVFFKNDEQVLAQSRSTFEHIAQSLGLRVLGWRHVPRDSSILGPAALSREPLILQPIVVLADAYGPGNSPQLTSADEFESKFARSFERHLYVLRKQSTHTIGLHNWFYICSLSNKNIVYKGQLAPSKSTNTTLIWQTSTTKLTLLSFTPVSLQTHSPLGTVPSP